MKRHGQNKETRLRWKGWVANNRELLLGCGLPHEIWEEERSWQYFLGHGTLATGKHPEHWFSLEQLSQSQLERLCDFLRQEFHQVQVEPSLLRMLRTILGLPQR